MWSSLQSRHLIVSLLFSSILVVHFHVHGDFFERERFWQAVAHFD